MGNSYSITLKTLSLESRYSTLTVDQTNIAAVLGAFANILLEKSSEVFLTSGCSNTKLMNISLHDKCYFREDATSISIFFTKSSLSDICIILSQIALGVKYTTDHVDLEFYNKNENYTLVINFDKAFVKKRYLSVADFQRMNQE